VTIHLLDLDTALLDWVLRDDPTWSMRDLPFSGAQTFTIPDTFRRRSVRFRLEATGPQGQLALLDSEVIPLVCHPFFYSGGDCSTFAPRSTAALYQPYQGGHIVWREDRREFYVLFQYDDTGIIGWQVFPDTWVEGEVVTLDETPPVGSSAPEGRFAKLWAENSDVQTLGWPTAAPQSYTMQSQTSLDVRTPTFDARFISWPDKRVVQLVTGGYAQGGPLWTPTDLFVP
jgi:hypothetical protein